MIKIVAKVVRRAFTPTWINFDQQINKILREKLAQIAGQITTVIM